MKQNITAHSPVFVIASVRTGSTMLRLMLDAHKNISNPGEFDFLFDCVQDNGTTPDIVNYLDWLKSNRIFNSKNLPMPNSGNFKESVHTYIYRLQQPNKILTLNIHRNFHRIPYIFPDSRYIHLIRDPRDVARSCIGMGWVGNTYYGVDIWKNSEETWDTLKTTINPDQYLEIKFEDLVTNTKLELNKICQFLGVEFDQHMLEYSVKSTYDRPNPELIFQWKKKYKANELEFVESKISDMIIERGYELSSTKNRKPSHIQRFFLYINNKAYRHGFYIRRYGLFLHAMNIVAQRSGIKALKNHYQTKINNISTQYLK